jgi:hypothetical protein
VDLTTGLPNDGWTFDFPGASILNKQVDPVTAIAGLDGLPDSERP